MGKEEVGLGKLNEPHSTIPLRWECGLNLELLVGEEEVGLGKLNESHSTIPLRWECGMNLELLVGEEEVGLEMLYSVSFFYPFKMGVRAEPGAAGGGGGGGAGESVSNLTLLSL